jgi:hypothetical protein
LYIKCTKSDIGEDGKCDEYVGAGSNVLVRMSLLKANAYSVITDLTDDKEDIKVFSASSYFYAMFRKEVHFPHQNNWEAFKVINKDSDIGV